MVHSTPTNKRRSRKRARDIKREQRNKPPSFDPCPPGAIGGQYKPLSTSDIEKIYQTSLRILEDIGMGEAPSILMQKALSTGAFQNQKGRLCFPQAMVEDAISMACKKFIYFGRENKHDFEVGGEKVYFGTGGAAVQTLDLDTHQYRPSTLRDLADFTRLIDTLPNVSWFTRCCVATDVPGILDLDINTAFALLKGTSKPVGTSFTVAKNVDPIIDMFDIAMGGTGKFKERPFCKAHISPVISPLRYGEDAVFVALACIKRGVPINNIVAAQSGATSPATLAGMLASSLAETLAALLMVNCFAPGYPMIFSNWPLVIDLRTGSFCGGGGESTLLNAASAQLSNWLGLPSGAACSMSDAKTVDAQMGIEKAISSLAVGLAGCNMVYESSGMTASLLGASFEAFVIDDEMLSHVYRTLRGIEVTEETLGYDAIFDAVYGDGHFLGGAHTFGAMERDYFYPSTMSDRAEPRTWQQEGSTNMMDKANIRVREILASHQPDYLNTKVDKTLRDRYNILM